MSIRHSREARELASHFYVAAREHRTYLRQRGLPEPASWPAIVDLLQTLAIDGRHEPVTVALAAMNSSTLPMTLTYAEAARIAGCSARTIRRRVADGAFPVVNHRIPREALLTYLSGD